MLKPYFHHDQALPYDILRTSYTLIYLLFNDDSIVKVQGAAEGCKTTEGPIQLIGLVVAGRWQGPESTTVVTLRHV